MFKEKEKKKVLDHIFSKLILKLLLKFHFYAYLNKIFIANIIHNFIDISIIFLFNSNNLKVHNVDNFYQLNEKLLLKNDIIS